MTLPVPALMLELVAQRSKGLSSEPPENASGHEALAWVQPASAWQPCQGVHLPANCGTPGPLGGTQARRGPGETPTGSFPDHLRDAWIQPQDFPPMGLQSSFVAEIWKKRNILQPRASAKNKK